MKVLKTLKVIAFNALLTLVLLEIGLILAAKGNLLRMDLPTYSIANIRPFWLDMDPVFGVWHAPNRLGYRHIKSCFDVTYSTNTHGMRDAERDLRANHRRVVVLGDSFVEGYGVAAEKRMTDLLESQTGIPHLNFGTSGNFGLTQSWLLYKTLASRFDHDAVIISILPANDFSDDDFANAKTSFRDRYRPYLVGRYPDYDLTYYRSSLIGARISELGKYAETVVNEFTYTARAYSYFKNYRKSTKRRQSLPLEPEAEKPINSYYFDFTDQQFDRLRYAIEHISILAAPRPVLVMTIARRSDYLRADREKSVPPLVERLSALSKSLNIQYIDLLDGLKTDTKLDELFHPCDPHWSAYGNAAAARQIGNWQFYRDRSRIAGEYQPGRHLKPEPGTGN